MNLIIVKGHKLTRISCLASSRESHFLDIKFKIASKMQIIIHDLLVTIPVKYPDPSKRRDG